MADVVEEGRELHGGEMLAGITNAIVRLQKEFYGKGPTKARTNWAGPDALLTLMGGGFTPVEKTLYESGQEDAVMANRHAFQVAMSDKLTDVIQGFTGRRVVAFLSNAHQNPDLTSELFILEPRSDDPDSPVRAENQSSGPSV